MPIRGIARACPTVACLAVMLLLGACAAQYRRASYRPPGPVADPWGPFIREAAARFGEPESWIRAVMTQESGGHQFIGGALVTSSAGAEGLMQITPSTYAELRRRYGLGPDPYDPHDNIVAGAAYLRELYDRYGSPGFLAAYNAGPRRVDSYLATGAALPHETVLYVAAVAPNLGRRQAVPAPDAVYVQAAATPVIQTAPVTQVAAYQPPVAAFQPPATASALGFAQPEPPAPPPYVPPASGLRAPPPLAPGRPFVRLAPAAAPAAPAFPAGSGGWAVQVGAFSSPELAREAADSARRRLPGRTETVIGVAPLPNGGALFRARVAGLSAEQAHEACTRLSTATACIVVPPDGA